MIIYTVIKSGFDENTIVESFFFEASAELLRCSLESKHGRMVNFYIVEHEVGGMPIKPLLPFRLYTMIVWVMSIAILILVFGDFEVLL